MIDTSLLAHPKQTGESRRERNARDQAARKALRNAIWLRDGGRSRASGKLLFPGHPIHDLRGEVAHIKGKGPYPELKMAASNCLLMSASEHILSDFRGGYRLKLTDPTTGEPAIDSSKPIKFTLYRKDGSVEWERIS